MTEEIACPRGHAVRSPAKFCSTCGEPVLTTGTDNPGEPGAPTAAAKTRRSLLIAGALAAVLALAAGTAVVVTASDRTATSSSRTAASVPPPASPSPSPSTPSPSMATPSPPTAPVSPAAGAGALLTCDAAVDPASGNLRLKGAANGLFVAWQHGSESEAKQCAGDATVAALLARPFKPATLNGCIPSGHDASARPPIDYWSCTFTGSGKTVLTMRLGCYESCGVDSVGFPDGPGPRPVIVPCDQRRDDSQRLASKDIADVVYSGWQGGERSVVRECGATPATLAALFAHPPRELTFKGCIDTDRRTASMFFETDCTYATPTIGDYLVIVAGCGASMGCQLEGIRWSRRAS